MANGKNKGAVRAGAHARVDRSAGSAPAPMGANASAYSRDSYGSAARRSRGPWRVVLVVSIVILIAALAVLGAIGYQYWAQQKAYDDLGRFSTVSDQSTLALSDMTVDWDSLKAVNSDIVAWVYMPGTPINYPVVQGADNEEYLHTAFDGSTGWLASAGTIFLDSTNASDLSDRNSALYGHHMNDGSMFASIADLSDEAAFNEHRDLYLLTPQGNYRLKTFALVDTVGSDAIVQVRFSSDASYRAYIQDKLDRSVVAQRGDVLTADGVAQSLLLSTCEYSQADGRAVLCAAVVETTVANDPYVTSVDRGTTGLSSDQDAMLDRSYKEAS